jgi:hypothetical protein
MMAASSIPWLELFPLLAEIGGNDGSGNERDGKQSTRNGISHSFGRQNGYDETMNTRSNQTGKNEHNNSETRQTRSFFVIVGHFRNQRQMRYRKTSEPSLQHHQPEEIIQKLEKEIVKYNQPEEEVTNSQRHSCNYLKSFSTI